MFSSKRAEDLGCTCYFTDEKYWFVHYGAVEPGSQMEPNYECFEHFPHPQHNAPNSILIAFRAACAHSATDHEMAEIAREWAQHLDIHFGPEAGHAIRVLTRLANLAEKESA